MIGIYGIIANESVLKKSERINAFQKMSDDVDNDDFDNEYNSGDNFSIGITYRKLGENKDLALKKVEDNFIIAFAGYGKFRGENKLFWAKDIIDKIIPEFVKNGENILTNVEGSFCCIIFYHNRLIIVSDRLGSKNLFYYDKNEKFVFSSYVGGVLSSGLVKKEKNIDGALQILVTGFFLDDSTLAKNINRFPAASMMRKNINKMKEMEIVRYWSMPKIEGTIDKITPELLETFEYKLKRSVYELDELESRSAVPLSGGLDSRTIACFLSEKQKINTITYNIRGETRIAEKVCKILKSEPYVIANQMITSRYFARSFFEVTKEQKIHSVLNQYFYLPFFKQYITEHKDICTIFDGVYMDILFSAPYTYRKFDMDRFLKTYGSRLDYMATQSNILNKGKLYSLYNTLYDNISTLLKNCDGVGKSQLFYATGRLRRYVNECLSSRENYCYVFKPGYNYDLMNFGFSLSLKIRKGLLYTALLKKLFPEVMAIKYKDSYGNREKTFYEKLSARYVNYRLRLSSATQGLIQYSPYQAAYFFIQKKRIKDYEDFFVGYNFLSEIFEDAYLLSSYNKVLKKYYLINEFQRILFIQQFYMRYDF